MEIIKIQRPLLCLKSSRLILAYNKDRSHWFEGEVDKSVIKALKGKPKAYFYAKLPKKAGFVEILEEAPEQDW